MRTALASATPIRFAGWLLALFLVWLPVAPAGATCSEIDPLHVLPDDGHCPGWVQDGDPQTAYTIEDLTDIINGGAYLFEQYGFVAAAFQDYAGQAGGVDVTIQLSLFNQGTAANAEALYNDPGSGMGDPIDDWPGSGEARLRVSFGFVYLQFWEECFFGSLLATTGGDDAVPGTRCLAEASVALVQGATPIMMGTWGRLRMEFR